MFPLDSFRVTLGKIVPILRDCNVPFHLTGGATAVAHAEPRFTQDVDIVLGNDAIMNQLETFLAALDNSDFLFDRLTIVGAVKSKDMFQLFDQSESLKLDLYPRELIEGELSRSVTAEIFDGVTLPIVSRGDAVVSKLMWIKKGSHKSRRDVKQIYRRCNDEDLKLIHDLADQMQLTELLQTVLAEPDEF